MVRLVVDLSDPDDLRDALGLIQRQLAQFGDEPGMTPAAAKDVSGELAKRVVDDLFGRISSQKTFELLRGFAELDGEVTLSRIAAHLDADAEDIRARKFRFGRTENAINEKYGIELLPGDWQGTENEYWMPEAIRHEIRSREP